MMLNDSQVIKQVKNDITGLIELFHSGKLYKYRKNEYILRADEQPQGVFMIKTGWVKSFSIDDSGNERIDYFHYPGDIFPLIWAFDGFDQEKFYAASSNVEVFIIPKRLLRDFFEDNKNLSLPFIDMFIKGIYHYRKHVENLEVKDVYKRVATFFFDVFERHEGMGLIHKGNSLHIEPVYANHQDIANYLNLTRETVTKKIQVLAKNNILTLSHKEIIIHDLKKLKKISGCY